MTEGSPVPNRGRSRSPREHERKPAEGAESRSKEGGRGGGDGEDVRTLYVAKLSYRSTTPELEELFGKYGKVPAHPPLSP